MAEQLMDPQMMSQQSPQDGEPISFSPEDQAPEEDMTEEYRANLMQMLEAVKKKYGEFSSMKIQSDNKISAMQEDATKQLMQIFQDQNIDPGDDAAINSFLEEIKNQDEDLYGLMESMIDMILTGIGNTPVDNNVSEDQVSQLATKLGEDNQQPVDGKE